VRSDAAELAEASCKFLFGLTPCCSKPYFIFLQPILVQLLDETPWPLLDEWLLLGCRAAKGVISMDEAHRLNRDHFKRFYGADKPAPGKVFF